LSAALRAAALGAGLALATVPAAAQQRLVYTTLDSAAAVRLTLTSGWRVTARLFAPFGPDSSRIVYCPGLRSRCGPGTATAPRVAPATGVTLIETRRGTRAPRGALIGAGVVVGVAAAFCALTDTGGCDPARGGFFSYVVLPAGLIGAGIGAVIGGSVSVWAPAP
jgi:hypothetical protein